MDSWRQALVLLVTIWNFRIKECNSSSSHDPVIVLKCCDLNKTYDDVVNECTNGSFTIGNLVISHNNLMNHSQAMKDTMDIEQDFENMTFIHKPLTNEDCNGRGRK